MKRTCSDCPSPISERSAGRCRPCAMREVATRDSYRMRKVRSAPCFTAAQIDRMRRVVDQYGVTVAAEILHTSTAAICRVKKRGWTVARRSPKPRARPSDFAIQAGSMTLHELARHYKAGLSTVTRWASEVGRKPQRGHQQAGVTLPPNVRALVAAEGIKRAAMSVGCHPDTLRRLLRKLPKPSNQALGWAERRFAA